MAFDGVVIANIVYDMNRLLTGGRIYKIYQPEADELLLVVKNNKETYRLLISAGASLPLIYFTTKTKANPMTAPNFCMLLRKYISNGRIIEITQPGMERIVEITIEHLNELGYTLSHIPFTAFPKSKYICLISTIAYSLLKVELLAYTTQASNISGRDSYVL